MTSPAVKILKIAGIVQAVLVAGVLAFLALRPSHPAPTHAQAAHEDAGHSDALENSAHADPAKAKHEEAAGHGESHGAAADNHHGDQGTGTAAPGKNTDGDPKAIARDLLDGNTRFITGNRARIDVLEQRAHTAEAQHPNIMVLGCADSRVPPELVFDKGIGELFVVRSAGNIAEPVAIGSLEYAAEHLHSKVLLVLGHEKCGAVTATLSGDKMPTPNLEAIVSRILPGIEGLKTWAEGDNLLHLAVEANVRRQTAEILKASPILRKAVSKGEITVLKAVYDIETGQVRPLP